MLFKYSMLYKITVDEDYSRFIVVTKAVLVVMITTIILKFLSLINKNHM